MHVAACTLLRWLQVAKIMKDMGVPYWRKDPHATADKEASNHGISAMKFQLIKVYTWFVFWGSRRSGCSHPRHAALPCDLSSCIL